eukprot:3821855-Heterocapsa_arctica.AAC.1
MTIWPWLVRHAAWLIERFRVRSNKRTAYEDNYGALPALLLGKREGREEGKVRQGGPEVRDW